MNEDNLSDEIQDILPVENENEENYLEIEESTNQNTNDDTDFYNNDSIQFFQEVDSNLSTLEQNSSNALYFLLINNILLLSILIYLFLHFMLERRKV